MVSIKKTKTRGFTLVETMVALTVFSLIIGTAVGIFVSSLRIQKKYLSQQELLDQVSYAMEYMSRNIRMAKKDVSGACIGAADRTYVDISGNQTAVRFKSYNDICPITFQYHTDTAPARLKESRAGWAPDKLPFLLSDNVTVNLIRFKINDNNPDNKQPRVTFFLDLETPQGASMQIQTTLSARNLDI